MPQNQLATSSVTLSTYPATAQIVLTFTADSIMLTVDSSSARMYVSFDGTNDHQYLLPDMALGTIIEERQTKNVWVRLQTANASGVVFICQALGEN